MLSSNRVIVPMQSIGSRIHESGDSEHARAKPGINRVIVSCVIVNRVIVNCAKVLVKSSPDVRSTALQG
jgi:hypothetical protein